MAFYQFQKEQLVNTSVDELWDFISSPKNLKRITPGNMGFDIISKDLPDKIYQGMIISYKVKPLFGIKVNWVTEITHVSEREYFVDEQRVGPYALWHHQHFIKQQGSSVLMKDIVSYKPPFGYIGRISNKLIIQNKLNQIFDYRKNILEKIFIT